jgi:predicted Zn finger-like uncharacterized protein
MPKIKAVCPECAAVLSLGESATPGKNVRCPKCDTVFTVPDESVASTEPNVRPRRFKTKKQSSPVGTIIAIVAASVLVLGGISFGGYYLFKKKGGGGSATAKLRPAPKDATTGINVSQIASEIEADDLDGVKFKLSDYRGKIILLDFWGHW